MLSLRRRPTGMLRVPVTAAGVSSRAVMSRSLGITFTQSLWAASRASISASGTSFFSLMVKAWLWQRRAPMRTHRPSTGMAAFSIPRILLVSAWPFHSSRLWPLSSLVSIQGMRPPASGTPKLSTGRVPERVFSVILRSMSRMAEAGSASSTATSSRSSPIWVTSSRMWRAPPPEAA